MEKKSVIYHIVTLDDLVSNIMGEYYTPAGFDKDGFIHCTAERSTTLLVLEDYFSAVADQKDILVLEIDVASVGSEVKYEAPAPIEGGGTSHIKEGALFPHIYGNLNLDAVTGAGKVEWSGGRFLWPSLFQDIKKYL
ncbi:MAG: DUF952 domain-containing protein [Spirochaetes bacterium]|nr:DUF952 domain-containing protein [Spirochaetota bacterium]